MEEFFGALWDRWITRAAQRDHPAAAVHLADIERSIGTMFRAFGGDAGLRVAVSADVRHGARRRWLQRIAHTGEKSALAVRDPQTLHLPESITMFPDRGINRDLYCWLVALAAQADDTGGDWLTENQRMTCAALTRYPGLASRYRRLVEASIAVRIAPERMRGDEAAQERAVRQALVRPGSVERLPPLDDARSRQIQPVRMWLRFAPDAQAIVVPPVARDQHGADEAAESVEQKTERKRYAAERTEMPDNRSPVIFMFRAESLLSWAEYVKVNRDTDDDPDPHVGRAAEDLDRLTVARDGKTVASKVRFDLHLPSAVEDDEPLGTGLALPEWDWRRRQLLPDRCRLQTMRSRDASPQALPARLKRTAQRLKSRFAALAPATRWMKSQADGEELDVDACVRSEADRLAGRGTADDCYLARRRCERDLACLVLADLSLSTDAWIDDEHRVIDVIRDTMMVFSEALLATGDAFALYGFSSLKRAQVRFHEIKRFDLAYDAGCRGRIAAVKPGYYTRMGAAVRRATALLERQPQAQRVLLLLSDGKPNDIDYYEGRFGIEDTRMSVIEARRAGLRPFCVTIDREGAGYLPTLFGPAGYTVVRRPDELPTRLPAFYAQLTAE